MRAVIQRLSFASATVGGVVTGTIAHGLVVWIGIELADTAEDDRPVTLLLDTKVRV